MPPLEAPIPVGDPELERNFLIKGNDESKVGRLFANGNIREGIQSLQSPSIHLRVELIGLRFTDERSIEDIHELKSIFDLFEEILTQLRRMDSAD